MKILLYGRLADAIGREVELAEPTRTVGDLRRSLIQTHPEVAETLHRSRAVASGIALRDDDLIPKAGVIELLPPVCGG